MTTFTTISTKSKNTALDLTSAMLDYNLVFSPHADNVKGEYYRFDVIDQGANIRERISRAIVDAGVEGLVWETPGNPDHCPKCLGYSVQGDDLDNCGISVAAVCVNGHEYTLRID